MEGRALSTYERIHPCPQVRSRACRQRAVCLRAYSGVGSRQWPCPRWLAHSSHQWHQIRQQARKPPSYARQRACALYCDATEKNKSIGRRNRSFKDGIGDVKSRSIGDKLHFHLIARMDLACHVSNKVAGIGKGDKRRVECGALLWGWREFAGQRAYGVHMDHYI